MQLKMPLSIELWVKKKRKYSISMNTYRNLHYQVSNNLKKAYKELLKDQLKRYWQPFWEIKLDTPITLTFIFYNWTKHLSDLENQCSIHNKFFQDALVELWYIDDDNYNLINKITYVYGGYRKNEWCVEILVS